MKLQTKASLVILITGTLVLLASTLAYQYYTRQAMLTEKQRDLTPMAGELARHADNLLKNKVQLALTLTSSPTLRRALQQSNAEYDTLAPEQRAMKISRLNQRWHAAPSDDDPFIQTHITNPAAALLRAQQEQLPDMYGEIFLTNRHGVMIATTGRLSTLAHAHKYWWQNSYADGKGVVFIDDRGFDTSVNDVVLGVVVPIKENGQIIGLLKCNFLIAGPLDQLVDAFNQHRKERLWLARSNGLIISGAGLPLSNRLPEAIIDLTKTDKPHSLILEAPLGLLVSTAPIATTLDDSQLQFGGSPESLGHRQGNIGEAWHMVVVLDKEIALAPSEETRQAILLTGAAFIALGVTLAILLLNHIVRPIHIVADSARRIGEGELDTRVELSGDDEICELAESLNQMADRLSTTMASRDELTKEIAQRREAERALTQLAVTDELTGAYNRRYFGDRLKAEIARAKRYHEPLSLVIFDADFFKKINDRLGHDVGDVVLQRLVDITTKQLRSQDTLTRWGGEEFVIIMPHTDLNAAIQFSERLRVAVAEHDFDIPQHITISLGVAELKPEDTGDSFIKRADTALFQAKAGGRNQLMAQSA